MKQICSERLFTENYIVLLVPTLVLIWSHKTQMTLAHRFSNHLPNLLNWKSLYNKGDKQSVFKLFLHNVSYVLNLFWRTMLNLFVNIVSLLQNCDSTRLYFDIILIVSGYTLQEAATLHHDVFTINKYPKILQYFLNIERLKTLKFFSKSYYF